MDWKAVAEEMRSNFDPPSMDQPIHQGYASIAVYALADAIEKVGS